MKKIIFYGFILLLALPAFAAKNPIKEAPSKYFTKEKVFTTDTFALNDYLEFSVFDMSKLVVTIAGQSISVQTLLAKPAEPTPVPVQATDKKGKTRAASPKPAVALSPPPIPLSPLAQDFARILPDLPKAFYKNLKRALAEVRVPITLYAASAPSYAKPIKLYVKLLTIDVPPVTTNKKGVRLQDVTFKIYGQLKDQKSDKVLLRFYDSAAAQYAADVSGALNEAVESMAGKTMQDLAQYLKSRY